MKNLATFVGSSGKIIATIFETDGGIFQVNLSENSNGFINAGSRFFKTEEEATEFASKFTDRGNKKQFLSEDI